jgi:TRAP-type mannitol/chloroaromatic compound transport system substrate-binding protein
MKPNPAGSVCPATEEWKAVHTGVLDYCAGGGSYMTAEVAFGSMISQRVAGIPPLEHLIWMASVGSDMINKWYQTKNFDFMDVKGAGFHGTPEIWIHLNKPLKTPADIRGLKMRCSGDGGAVLARLGLGTIFMPLGELFEAMKRGTIDAYECSSPQFDWTMKLNEVGKYIYLSPTRAPTEVYQFLVKRSKFEALPDDIKLIVEDFGRAEAIRYHSILASKDESALDNFRKYGNIVEKLPSSIDAAFVEEANKYLDEKAAKYPEAKEVLDSMRAFARMWNELYGLPEWAKTGL